MSFETIANNTESGREAYVPETGDRVYIDGLKDEAPAEIIGIGKDGKVTLLRPDKSTVEVEYQRLEPADVEAGQVGLLSDKDLEG